MAAYLSMGIWRLARSSGSEVRSPSAQTGDLLVKSGPSMGKSFKVEQGDLTIGRQGDMLA